MRKRSFSVASFIARKLASTSCVRDAKFAELEAEIVALRRQIEVQDGDIAFAQSILARYSLELESLIKENVQLRAVAKV